MPWSNLIESIEQGLLRRFTDPRPWTVDISDTPIAFRQFDVAAGLAGDTDKRVGKTAFGKQGFERLKVVFPEKTADGQLMPEVGQHLRHVHPFAGGVGVHFVAAIDLTGGKSRQLNGEVQRRVKGQG